MRPITSLLTIILLSFTAITMAQVPQAVNFQAIARDATGNVMVNTPIQIQLSILDNSSTGPVIYKELRALTTNAYGSFSFQIGIDPYTVLTGKMEDINWLQGKKFLKIDYDPTNQLQFSLTLGIIEFVSVPYAFAAGSVSKIDASNAKQGDVLQYNASSGNFEPAALNMDWSNIQNKPNLSDTSKYLKAEIEPAFNASVAKKIKASDTARWSAKSSFSGNYKDLINKPTIINTLFNNTSTGDSALFSNTSGIYNVAMGGFSLKRNTSGFQNVAIGWQALAANTIGSSNTAIGMQAIRSNTMGAANVAVGIFTLSNNTIGSWNTAVGPQCLNRNTGGEYNTAIGFNSLCLNTTGNKNTALGGTGLYQNTTGNNNVSVGFYALFANTSGVGNVAMGYNALKSNKSGSYNIAIGDSADVADTSLVNATAIGYNAKVNSSNKVVIGNANVTLIGGYATWTNYSDRRLKENIKYQNDLGLNFITKLKPVSYNYKADENKRRRDGLIAQDVDQALKELGLQFSGLVIDQDKDKTMNLSYGDFVIPLINSVQELSKQNKAMEQKINELNAAIEALKKQ